jgi:hypothetical protein
MINWPIEITQNKYSRWYEQLIAKARDREPIIGYTEKHHVIPNCFIKNKDVVTLTAREHYIAHLLLWKMSMSKKHHNQMTMALNVMVNGSGHEKQHRSYIVNSRLYETHRKDFSAYMSKIQTGDGNTFKGKKHTPESLEKMRAWQRDPIVKQQQRERVLGEKNHFFGKRHSEEMKKQISEKVAATWSEEDKIAKSVWAKEKWQDPEFKKRMLDIRHNSEGWLNRDWKASARKAADVKMARGWKPSEETKKKLSDTRKAKIAAGEIVAWNKGIKGSSKGRPSTWEVIDSQGQIFIITDGIAKFCKGRGFSYDTLKALAQGKQGNNMLYKAGWSAKKLSRNTDSQS